ncbi:phytanoyl-CoA dioxygenase family protein [Streptomyces sp. NPDC002845]
MGKSCPFEVAVVDAGAVSRAVSEHGLAFLPGYLGGAEVVAAVAGEASAVLDRQPGHARQLSSYPEGDGIRLERARAVADCARLAEVFEAEWMRGVAEEFFGREPYVFNHDLMVVRDVVGTEHLGQQMHYDRMPQLKFFLYLTDTTTANGAFRCLPGSQGHAKALQRENRRRLTLPDSRQTRLPEPEFTTGLVPVEGPAGSLIVIDSDIAHRGAPVERGHRLSVRSRSYHPAYLNRWASGPPDAGGERPRRMTRSR